MPDFLLCLESNTKPSVSKAQNYIRGGEGHRTDKFELEGRWDTPHTFLMSGINGVGTSHNIERKSLAVGRWVVQARE